MKDETRYNCSEEFLYASVLAAINNKTSANGRLIKTFLSSEPSEEDLQLIKKEIKYLMISICVFSFFSPRIKNEPMNWISRESSSEADEPDLNMVAKALYYRPTHLNLSMTEFYDRYVRMLSLIRDSSPGEFRRAGILCFAYQLKGGFETDCSDIDAEIEDVLAIGRWIWDTWSMSFGGLNQN